MFDKLVESTKAEKKGRNKFFVATSIIYGLTLSALAVLSILWFNPTPAEAFNLKAIFEPPPVPPAAPPTQMAAAPIRVQPNFAPTTPPPTIADPRTVPPAPRQHQANTVIRDAAFLNNIGGNNAPSPFIGDKDNEPPPPLPTPAPTPKATPTPVPTPAPQKIVQMTSMMITGKALRKVQPPYPTMAKAARIAGPVQVQILISEEGRVISASTVSGHPLLREASVQAAREWVFSPTILNGQGVKVSGILTFNFALN